jgi:hypothetical protein
MEQSIEPRICEVLIGKQLLKVWQRSAFSSARERRFGQRSTAPGCSHFRSVTSGESACGNADYCDCTLHPRLAIELPVLSDELLMKAKHKNPEAMQSETRGRDARRGEHYKRFWWGISKSGENRKC